MKKYLKLLPLILAVTALAGCSDKPHRTVVHHRHHVHKQTTLAVFYDTHTSTYWGSSNGVWYTYNTPGPLPSTTTARTASEPVTILAAPPSGSGTSSVTAPAAPSSNMSVPAGTTWGATTTTNRADAAAVSTADSALADKARMSSTFESQPGGTWTRAANPPPDEDLVAAVSGDETAVTITTDEEGKPETPEEVETENQQDTQMDAQEATEAASESSTESSGDSSSGSTETSTSSDSSSSSSDSSSGGDSGGGGGDSGGGGE